jgi:hypothetical protein
MARRLRFIRPFAISSSLLLNLHAFVLQLIRSPSPCPFTHPTYFLHTHMHGPTHTFYLFSSIISRAALFIFAFRSMNTVLYAPSSRTWNNF